MPIFDIDAGGKQYEVEAPDQASALAAISKMTTPEAEDSFAGSAKALGSGLVSGAASLAGLPADLAALGAQGLSALTGKPVGDDVKALQERYGSDAFKKSAEGVTGPLYEPKTFLEKTLRTGGEFASALVGGGAGIATKLATRVALPAVAAETAGALTDDNPYAKLAGALVGGAGGIAAERAAAGRAVAPVPTRQAIEAERTRLYSHPEVTGLEINNASTQNLAQQIRTGLDRGTLAPNGARIPEFMAPQTYRTIGLLEEAAGPTSRVADIDGVRKLLGEIAGEVGPNFRPTPNALAARHSVAAIDNYLANIPAGDVVRGNAANASRILTEARGNAAAGFRADKIERALERARNTANATHSGGNFENEVYKQIRTWLNAPEKHLRGWNQAEIAALREVLPGRMSGALRRVGKLLGGGGGLGQLASGSAGGAMFGFPGMVALPAVGMAANRLGSALTQRRLNNVSELVRSRAPAYAPGQAGYQGALPGGGLLGNLPPAQNAAVYAMLMNQRPPLIEGNR